MANDEQIGAIAGLNTDPNYSSFSTDWHMATDAETQTLHDTYEEEGIVDNFLRSGVSDTGADVYGGRYDYATGGDYHGLFYVTWSEGD
jgi:hypothetical protein